MSFMKFVKFTSLKMHVQYVFLHLYRGDYGVPPIVNLLDMVKVFTFAVEQGKVAVHCHAGLGEHYLESLIM